MQTYENWIRDVRRHIKEQQRNVAPYVDRTNLRAVYDLYCTPWDAVWLVLEVAARHGNADAKETLKERERRGR